MKQLEGLVAATFTPYLPDGSVNFDMIPSIVNKLIEDGLSGIFVCGSNGEGPNMTLKERMKVAEAFIEASGHRMKVIVHVGHSCIEDAKTLAAHASYTGADAVSAVSAFYFKPQSVQVLARCMGEIAKGCKELPFYYYHIPALTGVGMDMLEFLQIAENIIPNLAGIKYTSTTINEFQSCVNYDSGKFHIMYGYDELLLPALAAGAKAAIGSTYNFAAPVYLDIIRHFRNGEIAMAQEKQAFMVEVIRRMVKFSPIPAQKAIMKMMGWDYGGTRLPLQTLNEDEYDRLYNSLCEISFFETLQQGKAEVNL